MSGKLVLAELAAVAGFSINYFADAFKASTGLTPHRFVVERRIERATALLRVTEMPISEVGFAVGFSSQSHFTANFRRSTGVTPAAFRRSLD